MVIGGLCTFPCNLFSALIFSFPYFPRAKEIGSCNKEFINKYLRGLCGHSVGPCYGNCTKEQI